MDYAYFAVRHGLTLNRFYFARNIDSLVEQELELERERIIKGDARGDCIYVMKKDNIAAWMCPELYYYDLRGSIICVRDPVPGLLPYEAGLPARPDAGEKKP